MFLSQWPSQGIPQAFRFGDYGHHRYPNPGIASFTIFADFLNLFSIFQDFRCWCVLVFFLGARQHFNYFPTFPDLLRMIKCSICSVFSLPLDHDQMLFLSFSRWPFLFSCFHCFCFCLFCFGDSENMQLCFQNKFLLHASRIRGILSFLCMFFVLYIWQFHGDSGNVRFCLQNYMFLFCLILLVNLSGTLEILSLLFMLCFCFVYLSVFRGFGKCQVLLSKLDVTILFEFTCPFVEYSGNLKFVFSHHSSVCGFSF